MILGAFHKLRQMRGVWEGGPAKSDFIKKWALTKHMMREEGGLKKG